MSTAALRQSKIGNPKSGMPTPRLPAVCATRARWREERNGTWYTADSTGIRSGLVAAVSGDVQQLDFDTAIDLSYRYLEEADLAESAGDAAAEGQWAMWAEQLQIWAARRVGAPGRVVGGIDYASGPGRTYCITVQRTAVHHDDQAVSFAEMTRRN